MKKTSCRNLSGKAVSIKKVQDVKKWLKASSVNLDVKQWVSECEALRQGVVISNKAACCKKQAANNWRRRQATWRCTVVILTCSRQWVF